MSTKDSKEAKEPKELKHRPEALRLPQRKDSFTTVLTYLQGKTLPPRVASTASPVSTQSAPASPVQGLPKPRRHSNGIDVKKKARKSSTTLRRFSFSSLAGIQEDAGTKTTHSKASEGTPSTVPKTAKSSSSEKVNKTARETAEPRKNKSQNELPGNAPETKSPETKRTPPPMPKSILRVASPDGSRPPPRHIRSYSASEANPELGKLADATGLCPLSPTESVFSGSNQESGTMSQPTSPILRPLSPGATVRFANATVYRVDVGPGRRFAPVRRRSKSTVTYIAPLDPISQSNPPKVHIQSPTKLRRHQENQKAMGRYWQRTEEEEAQWRAEAERQAAEEAERYRAEPASPPAKAVEPHQQPWAQRLTALDKLPPLDTVTIPLLDKTESVAKSDADDKLETILASDSDESDAESDGGASTAMDETDEMINPAPTTAAKEEKLDVVEVKIVDREPSSEAGEKPAETPSKSEDEPLIQSDPEQREQKQVAEKEDSGGASVSTESTVTPAPTKETPRQETTGKETTGKETTEKDTPGKIGTQNQVQAPAMQATEPPKAKQTAGGAPLDKPAPEPTKAPTITPATPSSKTTDGVTRPLNAETPRARTPTPTMKKTIPTTTTTTTTTAINSATAPPENHRRYSRQLERSFSPEPYRERSLSRRPSPTLKHKKSMAPLAGAGGNHLHLSGGRKARRYLGDQKQEIAA